MILDRDTNTVTALASWKAISVYIMMAASPIAPVALYLAVGCH